MKIELETTGTVNLVDVIEEEYNKNSIYEPMSDELGKVY